MAFSLETLVSPRPAPTRIGPTLLLDVLVRENHDRRAEVTEFPVETGGNISDHIRNEPREISIEGFVTNNPVRFLGGIPAALIRGSAANDSVVGPNLNLVELAFAELERIYDSKELVEISTPRRLYQNMAMTRLSIPKDRGTGDALRFSASFREVTLVEAGDVTFRPAARTSQERSQPKKDAGKQTPPPATPKTEERLESVMFGIFN